MDLLTTLEQSGLTHNEAKVYLALVQHGTQAAGAITKRTGIHRRTVYDAIARLIEKGLVSYISTNTTKQYQATHPERLQEMIKEQEQTLNNALPQLEKLYNTAPARHETVFFRGKSGLKALFDDQLRVDNTVLLLGATPLAVEQLRYYFPSFDRQRIKKKVKVKLLFDQRAEDKNFTKQIPLSEVRVIRVKKPQDVVTCIYGDTVSIIKFGDNPFGILIREQMIADRYRDYFEILWRST